jgi:hypothetical protein
MSTFDDSSDPETRAPRPPVPACPFAAAPDCAVAIHKFWPACPSPVSDWNLATSNWRDRDRLPVGVHAADDARAVDLNAAQRAGRVAVRALRGHGAGGSELGDPVHARSSVRDLRPEVEGQSWLACAPLKLTVPPAVTC